MPTFIWENTATLMLIIVRITTPAKAIKLQQRSFCLTHNSWIVSPVRLQKHTTKYLMIPEIVCHDDITFYTNCLNNWWLPTCAAVSCQMRIWHVPFTSLILHAWKIKINLIIKHIKMRIFLSISIEFPLMLIN